jgi:hypothetical protein
VADSTTTPWLSGRIPTEGRWFLTGTCGAVNLDATWRIRVEQGTDDWMVKADATHPGRGSVVLGRCATELDALAAIDAIHHGAPDWNIATGGCG